MPCKLTKYKPNSSGYGSCYYRGAKVGAHVAAYLAYHGLHPDDIRGLVVMHTCDVRLCVNPEHLVLGTQSENIKDAVRKGRTPQMFGAGHRAKITQKDVDYIKANYRAGVNHLDRGNKLELAAQFNLNPTYVGQIARGYHDHRQWD